MAHEIIPIYIGISKAFDIVKGMTERSIRENTILDESEYEIIHLYPEKESGCTGFSNVRYTIKKGIYLDCDMIVLGDIAELWSYHKPGKFVCMKDRSDAVAVIDCNHSCRTKFQKGSLPLSPDIPLEWNVEDYRYFDSELPSVIKNFHFTSLPHQPWFFPHPIPEAIELYEHYKPNP